jgi:HK97 family phage major capsid protein
MSDDPEQIEFEDEDVVTVRSAQKREIDVRLVPFDKTISTRSGLEEYAPGSFEHMSPDSLLLQGLEHDVAMGVGQNGDIVPTRRPQGRSNRIWEQPDGAYATFKVARTQAGDEIIALAEDRVIRGVSVETVAAKNTVQKVRRGGRSVDRITKAAATGAALTYRPAYGEQATVLAVRSLPEGEAHMGENVEPVAGVNVDAAAILSAITASAEREATALASLEEKFAARFERLEEDARADIVIPGASEDPKVSISKGEWLKLATRLMTGERIPDAQMRTLDDVITTDNVGMVPPAYLTELIGVIDPSRPFLTTTRRLPTPSSGTKLIVPVINQRPEVGVQNTEKQEVASTKTLIGTTEFDMVSIAGAGDLSIQLIKRSSPEFLSLWVELLAEQYARVSEDEAITALLDAMGGIGNASPMDPADLQLGDAYVAAFDAIRRGPDTLWLSTKAVGEFIDAKATTTNQPLYSNIQLDATVAGGVSGNISGLRAVHVPILDAHGAYALVGPSSGFAWAEDGTYTLQVDNAAHAGRDVALVGMLWPAPWYPAAFTAYNVAS